MPAWGTLLNQITVSCSVSVSRKLFQGNWNATWIFMTRQISKEYLSIPQHSREEMFCSFSKETCLKTFPFMEVLRPYVICLFFILWKTSGSQVHDHRKKTLIVLQCHYFDNSENPPQKLCLSKGLKVPDFKCIFFRLARKAAWGELSQSGISKH